MALTPHGLPKKITAGFFDGECAARSDSLKAFPHLQHLIFSFLSAGSPLNVAEPCKHAIEAWGKDCPSLTRIDILLKYDGGFALMKEWARGVDGSWDLLL